MLTKYSDGTIVGSSLTRYTPFGGYRTGGPNQLTDRAYTGQRENMDLGLYYYNARYYAPYLNRFLSADTLVPDPQNPQSFNRYAYVLNSPIRYSDPSGHLSEDEIQKYFGYGSSQAMIDEGWNENLVNWLWDPGVTWGDVFLYDDGAAMLVLFEAIESGSNIFVGGFYGLTGKQTGQQVSHTNITWLDDHDSSATNMERSYFENWENLPMAYGTDGTPYYVPSTYVDIATPKIGLAGLSIAGGVALVGCAIAEPCGIITTGSTLATVSTFVGATSTMSGFVATAVDMINPNVTLTDVYPTILLPNQYSLGTPPVHYHLDIAGGPRGLYEK